MVSDLEVLNEREVLLTELMRVKERLYALVMENDVWTKVELINKQSQLERRLDKLRWVCSRDSKELMRLVYGEGREDLMEELNVAINNERLSWFWDIVYRHDLYQAKAEAEAKAEVKAEAKARARARAKAMTNKKVKPLNKELARREVEELLSVNRDYYIRSFMKGEKVDE
jgi:hypothetical protein